MNKAKEVGGNDGSKKGAYWKEKKAEKCSASHWFTGLKPKRRKEENGELCGGMRLTSNKVYRRLFRVLFPKHISLQIAPILPAVQPYAAAFCVSSTR